MIVAFGGVASANPGKKIEFLLRFYDLNEAAFAYHRHCLSQEEGLNAVFLNNLEFVADELFAEIQKSDVRLKPDYIKTKILQRRYNIQYKLDRAHMVEGCYSPAIKTAKEHYIEFSRFGRSEVSKFIDEKTVDRL